MLPMKKDRPHRKSTIPENAKLVFEGKIFDTYQWEQELYDGTQQTFERVSRNDTAVIYPVLSDGTILLIRDWQPQRDVVITAPSGRLEIGERPEEAILRELLEETGYQPKKLEPFYTIQPYEKIDWVVNVFIGKNCTKIKEPVIQAGEKIELNPVTFDELINLVVDGKLREEGFTQFVLQALRHPEKMNELRRRFSI